MIVKAFQTYLESISGITAKVSTRIYPHHLPKTPKTYPVITHQLVDNDHLHHIGSASGSSTARIQVDCWGQTMADVETLAEAVRAALQGYSGAMGAITVSFVQLAGERDLHEPPKEGSNQWLYRRSMDFQVKYKESVPTF